MHARLSNVKDVFSRLFFCDHHASEDGKLLLCYSILILIQIWAGLIKAILSLMLLINTLILFFLPDHLRFLSMKRFILCASFLKQQLNKTKKIYIYSCVFSLEDLTKLFVIYRFIVNPPYEERILQLSGKACVSLGNTSNIRLQISFFYK